MTNEPIGKPIEGPDGESFDDFDACVAHFDSDDAVDDPEAFCEWLEDGGTDAVDDADAEEVLTNLSVEFVSAVDEPAQDSEWLIAKSVDDANGDRHEWGVSTPLLVEKDAEQEAQVAFAPVLIPGEVDKDGDVVPDHEIESAAWDYLKHFRKVDTDHDLLDGKGTPVESYTLKEARTFDLPDGDKSREYPAGTWVLGIEFEDDAWDRVKSGDLSGLSIYGGAASIDADELAASFGGGKSAVYDTMFNQSRQSKSKQPDDDALPSFDDDDDEDDDEDDEDVVDALKAVAGKLDDIAERVARLEAETDAADFANGRMNGDGGNGRTESVKSILSDDDDVARKAVREQTKSTDADLSIDYSGITDGENVTADASDVDAGTGTGSSANPRMVGDDN